MGHFDIIVVGAGPVGLTVALGAAKGGLSVAVLEKNCALSEHAKAPAIWPGSLETFGQLGVVNDVLSEGTALPEVMLWDADRKAELLHIDLQKLRRKTNYPKLVLLPQPKLEKLLFENLSSFNNAKIYFGTRLVSFKQIQGRIDATACDKDNQSQHFSSDILIGCDGAKSTVRSQLDIDSPGHRYEINAALADISLNPAKDNLSFPRFTTKNKLAIGILIGANHWRLILPGVNNDNLDSRIEKAVKDLLSTNNYEVIWKSEFDLYRMNCQRYAKGRVALAGDAAHLNCPVGGQGMNAGIQDAGLLLKKLMADSMQNTETALREYSEERHETIEASVNSFTDSLTKFLLAGNGRFFRAVLTAASWAMVIPTIESKALTKIAMLNNSSAA